MEQVQCDFLNGEAADGLDELQGLLVSYRRLTAGTGRLIVELLQYLHGQGQVSLAQQCESTVALAGFLGQGANGIEQHVSVNESHWGR